MSKVFVEEKEIKIVEKPPAESGEHTIDGDFYVLHRIIKKEFKSYIYKYCETEKLIISKVNFFNEEYYKIIYGDDHQAKAWNLIELSSKLDVRVRRLTPTMFLVIGDNKNNPNIMAQISFCRIKPSLKVEEFTTSFSKLNTIYVLKDSVLVSYMDISKDDEEDKVRGTVATYNFDGKLIKTHYELSNEDEYDDDDDEIVHGG
ncbi:MAG: hypothetical protein FWE16_03280 [Firmicutes bacterium]|nr:hypothetical protein [Bacillota bacterium]